ncbi:hypothetical protein YPPY96_4488, partial [Yersinia pestis PY-96]
MAPDN